MTAPEPEPSTLPPEVRRFAPWTWSRRKRWLLAVLLPLAYVESPIPVVALFRRGLRPPAGIMEALAIVWWPLETTYNRLPFVKWFYDRQFEVAAALWEIVGL